MTESIEQLNQRLVSMTTEECLAWAIETFETLMVASSLGLEDMVILHMIAQYKETSGKAPRVFMLDTGRLHQETYDLLEKARQKYDIEIDVFFPDSFAVESLVRTKGPNSFYVSVENRKECCRIRKVEPLRRALRFAEAWMTGLRREQSVTRTNVEIVEKDKEFSIVKINPLAHWSLEQVWDYIRNHNVPYNRLHNQGFPSIGCAPCTRAIAAGEDIRAGRWWWENPDLKECGLHSRH